METLYNIIVRNEKLLINILQEIQQHYHNLPKEILEELSKILEVPLIDIYGVATFYRAFRFKPAGKHLIKVCTGTACHVKGGKKVLERIEEKLNITPGNTTNDFKFTLETVNCLGACALGPIMVCNEKYYGNMNSTKVSSFLKKLYQI